jgi:hypothetical protein
MYANLQDLQECFTLKDAWSGQPICYDSEALTAGAQFTCFTGTKVQTLTQLRQCSTNGWRLALLPATANV